LFLILKHLNFEIHSLDFRIAVAGSNNIVALYTDCMPNMKTADALIQFAVRRLQARNAPTTSVARGAMRRGAVVRVGREVERKVTGKKV